MKRNKLKKVQIQITTFEKNDGLINMNEDKNKRIYKPNLNNKFLCLICLNSKEYKSNENKINSQSRHICQRTCDICLEKTQNKAEKANIEFENLQKVNEILTNKHKPGKKKKETKSVQTEQTDFNKSLNLLNEVLTVFQSNKFKSAMLKDASVSTNDFKNLQSKLSISKIFKFSIDQNKANENGKFIVISSKTDDYKRSYINLTHKSSSIPQMKLEELKHSLKEKTKSKDAIEEVNRLFATVRRNYKDNDLNRPSIRSGPRLLPVVETIADHNEKLLKYEAELSQKLNCKCCQTNNCMSSGDTLKYCHVKDDEVQCYHKREREKCDKCVYMLCCHYKNSPKWPAGVMTCERCRDVKEFLWKRSERNLVNRAF